MFSLAESISTSSLELPFDEVAFVAIWSPCNSPACSPSISSFEAGTSVAAFVIPGAATIVVVKGLLRYGIPFPPAEGGAVAAAAVAAVGLAAEAGIVWGLGTPLPRGRGGLLGGWSYLHQLLSFALLEPRYLSR